MAPHSPTRPDIFGFYRLDGQPVVVRPGRGPETHDGQRVDWTEWAHRAVRISRAEYSAMVRALPAHRVRGRQAGLEIPTLTPGPRTARPR